MTTFAFRATTVVTADPDAQCHLAGFADQRHDPKYYLTLTRAFEADAQDAKLGLNTYHVEWCSQKTSAYGGIARLTLKPEAAEISFEPRVAQVLGLDHLTIAFRMEDHERIALRDSLSAIFASSGRLEITEA